MNVPSWFLRLSPAAQEDLVARARAGLIDPLPYLEDAERIVAENQEQDPARVLPGGTRVAEVQAAAARKRAGLVDRDYVAGMVESRSEPLEFDPLSEHSGRKAGFVASYPWQRG